MNVNLHFRANVPVADTFRANSFARWQFTHENLETADRKKDSRER